jgi:hypothetical protein
MLIWHKNYGLLIMGQAFFIILGQIGEARPKSVCLSKNLLLPQASMLQEADALFKTILTRTLQSIVNLIPLEWLDWQDTDESLMQFEVYLQFYQCAEHSQIFIKEAQNARETLI